MASKEEPEQVKRPGQTTNPTTGRSSPPTNRPKPQSHSARLVCVLPAQPEGDFSTGGRFCEAAFAQFTGKASRSDPPGYRTGASAMAECMVCADGLSQSGG